MWRAGTELYLPIQYVPFYYIPEVRNLIWFKFLRFWFGVVISEVALSMYYIYL